MSSYIGTRSTPNLCGACGAYDVTTYFHLDDVIWGFPVSILDLIWVFPVSIFRFYIRRMSHSDFPSIS